MSDSPAPHSFATEGPAWQYHTKQTGTARPRGRTLRLLSFAEIKDKQIMNLVHDYAKDWIRHKSHKHEYHPLVRSSNLVSEHLSSLGRHLRALSRSKVYNPVRDELAVQGLNFALNQIFSDEGWKLMRRRITQLGKFKKSARPILSSGTNDALIAFRDAQGLSSLDEAVQVLIAHYHQTPPDEEAEA